MFGENLKKARIKKGITQKEFAEMVGVSGPMMTQIERGTKQASPPLIAEICKVLECTSDSLIYGEQNT